MKYLRKRKIQNKFHFYFLDFEEVSMAIEMKSLNFENFKNLCSIGE